MKAQIQIYCPHCQGASIKKNGIKSYGKQNYLCQDCKRQFIGDHNLSYQGCHSKADKTIRLMTANCCGIRSIARITGYSKDKIQRTLRLSKYEITPRKSDYAILEVDEFHTFVGSKQNKVWLQYAYERDSGEIVAFVWGKRDFATALKLRKRLQALKITVDCIATDHWESFTKAFKSDKHIQGKQFTVGIEGNNCRLRHRVARTVRRSCCFSKKMPYHLKVFDLAFAYVNNGHV